MVTLDETAPPPALVIGASADPGLPGPRDRLDRRGWKLARLPPIRRRGGMQAADYLMLMVLNRNIGVLRHLSKTFALHPECCIAS